MSGSAMSQTKDPAIKLFGRSISVPDIQIPAKPPAKNLCSDITKGGIVELDKSAVTDQTRVDQTRVKENEGSNSSISEHEKFKKPDKILPCPRCNSLDTKFCYFNNYNVNQPRHFCKNCQRYWTAGGTMRNVPIGAGRRRNKHLASQYRQILVSPDGIPLETPESENIPAPTESPTNGTVMKFGSEAPLCESMEKTLNLVNNTRENVEERLGGPTAPLGVESVEKQKSSSEAAALHPQCYPVPPPWVFPWAPGGGAQVQWPVIVVPPGFCPPPSNIPVQLVPASYCMPLYAAYSSPRSCSSTTTTTSTSCCSNGSPRLGKHSRDEEQAENCVLVPKTLRIDDPKGSLSNGSVFKNFEAKCEGKGRLSEAGPILEANPAALSRVNTFQESS